MKGGVQRTEPPELGGRSIAPASHGNKNHGAGRVIDGDPVPEPASGFQGPHEAARPEGGVLDPEKSDTAREASLEPSKELAMKWANERSGDGRGDA